MTISNSLFFLTVCSTCLVFCAGSPTRRQFISYTDTETSSAPARIVNSDEVWDDSDDFDLDGDENWLGEAVNTPSSIPERPEYQDYDGEREDEVAKRGDFDDEDDIETQDQEEEETSQLHNGADEFLFLPAKESNLLLQIDSEKSSTPIKVRHTGRNSFTDLSENSIEDSKDDDKEDHSQDQFEFTIDNDDDDDDNAISAGSDDIVIEETQQPKDSDDRKVEDLPKTLSNTNDNNVDDDDDGDDNDTAVDNTDDGDDDEEDEDDQLFETADEDSQVIYGDHVFLY